MNLDIGDTRLIIAKCSQQGLLRNQTAYTLGTTCWETAHTMMPVRETLADTDEQAIHRLDNAWQRGQLPWVSRPYWRDGWFGRGFVQLTHRYNYVKAGQAIGVDMVADPSLALDADVAAEVLVRGMVEGWFTGKKLGDYVTLERSDYVGARRVVNGTDKAHAIAELARDYEAALLAEGYGVEKVPPVVNTRRDGTPPRESKTQSQTVRMQVTQWLSAYGAAIYAFWNGVSEEMQIALVLGLVAITITGAIILRERLRKWAEGDR